jgi:sugar phosphate isomerase/epimerase
MNPSVSTWSTHHLLQTGSLNQKSFLDLVARNRINMIEIVDIDFKKTDLSSMEELKKDAVDRGISISCMSLEHDLCRLTEEERAADIAKVKNWMEISKKLEVRNVRAFTGWHKPNIPYPIQMEWVYEGLSVIAEEAERLDLFIVLENHDDVCLGAEEILTMFRRISSNRLYTCPDIFNYKTMKGENIPEIGEWSFTEIEKLLPLAKNVHLKICKAVEENTNDSFLDVKRVFNQLNRIGYTGPVALEFMWPYLEANMDECAELEKAMQVLAYWCNKPDMKTI